MSIEKVRGYLKNYGLEESILEFDVSSATVELAAAALGVDSARIAKSISLRTKDGGCMIVVTAGDTKIDNAKFKATFGFKARMLSHDEAYEMTGHAVGGVCPFALPEGTNVWLDSSLKRFSSVFPACGSSNSAIELSPEKLFDVSCAKAWVDVCSPRQ